MKELKGEKGEVFGANWRLLEIIGGVGRGMIGDRECDFKDEVFWGEIE